MFIWPKTILFILLATLCVSVENVGAHDSKNTALDTSLFIGELQTHHQISSAAQFEDLPYYEFEARKALESELKARAAELTREKVYLLTGNPPALQLVMKQTAASFSESIGLRGPEPSFRNAFLAVSRTMSMTATIQMHTLILAAQQTSLTPTQVTHIDLVILNKDGSVLLEIRALPMSESLGFSQISNGRRTLRANPKLATQILAYLKYTGNTTDSVQARVVFLRANGPNMSLDIDSGNAFAEFFNLSLPDRASLHCIRALKSWTTRWPRINETL